MDNSHKNNITKIASADLLSGTVVKLKSSDTTKVEACAATDANAIGVVLDSVKSGDNVAVALFGIANHTVQIIANAAIAAGAKVFIAASGKVQPAPAAGVAAQTVYCVGIALTAAYADGNIVEVAHHAPITETIAATD